MESARVSIQGVKKECILHIHREGRSVIKKAILFLHGRWGVGEQGQGGGQTDEGRSEVNVNRNTVYNNLEHYQLMESRR